MQNTDLKQIYLIRHGHPRQGTGIPYDRVPGPPLSEQGEQEARAAGLYLAAACAVRIDRLYSSPLDRAIGTAQQVSAWIERPFIVEDALAEHRSDESFEQVRRRVRDWLARVMGEPVVSLAVVTHGSPIKAFLQLLSSDTLNLSAYSFDTGNHAPTAGIWSAARQPDGSWQLELAFTPQTAASVV